MLRALVLLGKKSREREYYFVMKFLFLESPVSELDGYRLEVLVAVDKLER